MRPEVFSIRLLPRDVRSPDGQRLGEICIGSFLERFAVYPLAGTEEGIAARWLDELRLLISGTPAVGLPTASNMAWVLYRSGSEVRVRQMLMLSGVGPKLARSGKVTHIPAYAAFNADGERSSEWSTTVEAIRAFVAV